MKIGILALQGDFNKHAQAVKKLGHTSICLKDKEALLTCEKLIIPGGESTTIIRLIEKLNLRSALMEFAEERSLMGTCAGLIILGNNSTGLPFPSLELIDVEIIRNAYGRQIDSFIDTVQLDLAGEKAEFEGVFIRAPKITRLGLDVKLLGYLGKNVVLAANKNILVSTFHPELTEDLKIHDFFINSMS